MPIYLGIYDAVLEALLFQFQCRFIFNRFMTEEEKKPKLVFAQPKKKHKLFENGCLAEAELDLYVAEIFYLKIRISITYLGFSYIEVFDISYYFSCIW